MKHIETTCIHHPPTEILEQPISAPLYQTSTFKLKNAQAAFEYTQANHPHSFYSRWGNPTVNTWEKLVATLEHGEQALAFSSGMAAISTSVLTFAKPGEHIIAPNYLYSGTTEFLNRTLKNLSIEVDFIDPTEIRNFKNAIKPNTKLIYIETPANPLCAITDIKAVTDLAKKHQLTTICDNTFASPLCQNPLLLGCDIVVHSATKYLSGHSDVIAGCVIGKKSVIENIWQTQKLLGGCLDPFAAWLLLRGAKTLAVRMERHCFNAQKFAEYLNEHKKVERVLYPGLKTHPGHNLAKSQMHGFGGMLSFCLKASREQVRCFVEATKIFTLAVSLGGTESLITHPASMTHATLSTEELKKTQISPNLVRVSVGLEHIADLISDFEQALALLS